MLNKRNQRGFAVVFVLIVAFLILAIFVFLILLKYKKNSTLSPINIPFVSNQNSPKEIGKSLSDGHCVGNGVGLLTHSAMNPTDFLYIIPYGLMTGGHVIPIDHQYYAVDRNSPRDAFPVYAMGDAHIVRIEHRTSSPGDNAYVQTHRIDEYRVVFSQSCTFFYYYDLLTSLSPDIQTKLNSSPFNSVDIPVKAGQEVGRIGGQTLDFAVWDTTKELSGFIVPEHYSAEPWKVYVADPLNYESSDLKSFMLSRYPRIDEPLSGRIDWDIDGKLRGNWFLQGSGGEQSNSQEPWSNQLSFSPDLYDPSHFVISIGNFGPGPQPRVNAQQFYAKGNSPDPKDIGPNSGLVKYELVNGDYLTPFGNHWDRSSFVRGLRVIEGNQVYGTILIQMTDARTIKFEAFPSKGIDQVGNFDSNTKIYTR